MAAGTEKAGAILDSSEPKLANAASRYQAGAEGRNFLDRLKIKPVNVEKGAATFEVTVDDSHLRTMGIAHGGLIATMLDTCLGCACWTLAPPDNHVVTVQLNINYIRPAWLGEKLTARSEVRHAGQMTAVSRGEIRTAEGALVAAASGTFMYLPVPAGAKPMMEKRDELERWKTS
jgi:acyl-CoA thioesterase